MVPVRNTWVKHKTMARPSVPNTHTHTHTHIPWTQKVEEITVVSGISHKHTNYAIYEKHNELSQYKHYKDIIHSIMDHPQSLGAKG
jgi:hypothetical protein